MTYNKMWAQLKAQLTLAEVMNKRDKVSIDELRKLMQDIETRNGVR